MSADTLSLVLRAVRLTGAMFFDVRASAPWVAEAPPGKLVASKILPGSEHVIEYHAIVKGSCFAGLIDQPPLELQPGDVIVFPQGDPHVVSSAPGMRGDPSLVSHERPADEQLPVIMNLGGSGAASHLVCGFLGCDATPFNPLLATLPRVLCLRAQSLGGRGGLAHYLIEHALAESRERRPGGECLLARVSEVLFVEAVRQHVEALPPDATNWLSGLRDPCVGKALAKLHEAPSDPWTLDSLARATGSSRSVLAERFAAFVGMPPMQYLARWRMQLAAGLLDASSSSLAEIAEKIGYGSEAAFSRAFKRWVGMAPAMWRQRHRQPESSERARELSMT